MRAVLLGAFAALSVPFAASAAPLNFESGDFTGWMTLGQASIVDASYGTGPIQGTYSALLENGADKTGGNDILGAGFLVDDIETFLGVATGSIASLFTPVSGEVLTEGSAMKTTFAGIAGQMISFDYKILADDCDLDNCPGGVEDGIVVTIAGDGFVDIINGTFGTVADGSGSPYYAESGVLTFQYTLLSAGTFDLGIAVLDGGDDIVSSAVMVDSVNVDPIPVPAALPLMLTAFAGIAALRARHARKA